MQLRLLAIGVVAGFAGLLLPVAGQAEIERSVDQDGVIHFRNAKPNKSLRRRQGTNRKYKAVMPSPGASRHAGRYEPFILEAAALYKLPADLIRAVMKAESNFDPRAVSPANAHGLMQLLPSTAERMMVNDIFDPRQNILGGARYLRLLANIFNGNLQLTIAGYNAGEAAVAKYGGIPPYAETQAYVTIVLSNYRKYRER